MNKEKKNENSKEVVDALFNDNFEVINRICMLKAIKSARFFKKKDVNDLKQDLLIRTYQILFTFDEESSKLETYLNNWLKWYVWGLLKKDKKELENIDSYNSYEEIETLQQNSLIHNFNDTPNILKKTESVQDCLNKYFADNYNLHKITPEDVEYFILKYFDGYSIREIQEYKSNKSWTHVRNKIEKIRSIIQVNENLKECIIEFLYD